MKYAILAGDHNEFDKWVAENVIYIGNIDAINSLDPSDVSKVLLVGNFQKNPIYWSDELIRLQIEVALSQQMLGA
jgi:hypothetical protein